MSKIAIIGMSGLFPGSADVAGFWDNLMAGKDLTGMADETDFSADPAVFFQPGKGIVDKCYSLRGGYIRGFEFDPEGYLLPADYLAQQDKLYQWSLFAAREALRDSGYLSQPAALQQCGLVLGNLSFPTGSSHRTLSSVYSSTMELALRELLADDTLSLPRHETSGHEGEILASPTAMVAAALGLNERHYSLDAACATSLYAIKLACDELLTGKADMMLAGAVCASDQLFIHIGFSIFHAYAEADKKFVPLDKNSAGLVSAEGAGMVALKRLSDAQRDGDQILGVIGGIGLSNDGRGKFLLSPNPKGQQLAFERAYTAEDIFPHDTSYLECHATGTPLGDVTEMNSIAEFFAKHGTRPSLGSVKSNMGHLLTAAGMTGLLKVLLSMRHGIIPPNINLEDPIAAANGWIGGEQMILSPQPWPDAEKQAGVNSFGFGGTNAHLVVRNYVPHTAPREEAPPPLPLCPMAITGMDAHFGDCADLAAFHASIHEGRQHFRDLPAARWNGFEANAALLRRYGLDRAPQGAYIEDFDIDLLRHKIQPNEVDTLEPQQALILKVADRALKDAGLAESRNIAVLVAMESELAIHHYLARWDLTWQLKAAIERSSATLSETQYKDLEELCKNAIYFREGKQTPSQHTSFVGNIMASRIAALWDFSGPAFTLSNGENATFKALEVAQHLLSMGEVEAVVVGAVDFGGGLESVLLRSQAHPVAQSKEAGLSWADGHEGWLPGEGAGVIVLKRADVVQPHERVYATIDEIVNPPKTADITADYIELAATGITAADQREIASLQQCTTAHPVALGSVKANVGHTFAAAGMAAIIKTALCLHHRFIPGIPKWQSPKPAAHFGSERFYYPEQSRPWLKAPGQQRRQALVNGADGTQVRMAEAAAHPAGQPGQLNTFLAQQLPAIFPLKADTRDGLHQQLAALEIACDTGQALTALAPQFYEAFLGKAGQYCAVLVASSQEKLRSEIAFFKQRLDASLANGKPLKTPQGSYFTPTPLGADAQVAFVYPGSATAYPGLGRNVFQLFPDLLDHFEALMPDLAGFVSPGYLYPRTSSAQEARPNIHSDAIAMMATGVFFSAVFTQLLQGAFKLRPQMALGYSMGECSSMWYAQGLWRPQHAAHFKNSPIFKSRFTGELELLAQHWGTSSEEAKARWVSLVLLCSAAEARPLVDAQEEVYLTFINSPSEIIISGDRTACLAVADTLGCERITVPFQNIIHHGFCRAEEAGLLAMHSFPLEQEALGYRSQLQAGGLAKPETVFYSSITQAPLPMDSEAIARNSTEVCCRPVDFPATVAAVYEAGARIFIEVGAGATCTGWIGATLKDQPHLALAIDQKGRPTEQVLPEVLAQLLSHGLQPDLSALYGEAGEVAPARAFLRKITPGGQRIFDALLTEENRNYFAPAYPPASQTHETFTTVAATAIAAHKTSTKMDIKTTPLPTTAEAPAAQLGENGLLIHDFSTGAHLEGKEIIFTEADLEEFAYGKIANVFGPEYAIIDSYPRRVMLPKHPYLLVSRVTGLRGELGQYKPSFMQTEYDIPHNAWFTTDRQIPWAVSVESGQCDLMLISYLGIDLQNKGHLMYRLLDCTLTFVDDLPFEGQTLRYDIHINSFVRNGPNLLFFFSYECFVQDRLVLKMDGGCAGFFSEEQLSAGNGVVYSESELAAKAAVAKRRFTPLLNTAKRSFSQEDLQHLIQGSPEKCFGDISYYANGRNPSLCLPPEQMLMLDRIVSVDLEGGAYGLGLIIAEKDLHPDDWYFPCHFRDDEVLAGSLQAEGGGNLLRFFMLMLGLQRLTKDARYQPVFDLPQKVRCRKEVTTKDTLLVYRLEIKDIGLIPNPYVIGDLEIISDGIVTVHFENLGLQLREKSQPKYLETTPGIKIPARSEGALLNEEHITTFALDNLSKCFGPDFAVYDGRTVSRQPNTDLQLISRVLRIDGERMNFKQPATIYAEYDVPQDAWYYAQNSANTMPYSILMEIALQPCGLLGAWLGSTLQFPDKNLYFRNLDGTGEMLELPQGTDFRGKTVTNKAVLASSVALGGTILQNYTFECAVDGQVFYRGKSSFGFFPGEALAGQVGLDNGTEVPAWYQRQGLQPKDYVQINLDSLYGKMKLFKAPENQPHYRLAGGQLHLLDKLLIVKGGGQHGQGYVHASKAIKTYDWFFTCHFYQDPVMPGSLGVEAILEALQVYAIQQGIGSHLPNPRFTQVPSHTTQWKYRGQILLHAKEMHLEVHIKSVESTAAQVRLIADAFLWNGGTRIYQVSDLAMGIS